MPPNKKNKFAVMGLGALVDNENGTFTMSTDRLRWHYANHGVPNSKRVFANIKATQRDLVLAGSLFLADVVARTKQKATIRYGRGGESFTVAVTPRTQLHNVQTNKTLVRYGRIVVVSTIKVMQPTTDVLLRGRQTKISDYIKAAFDKEELSKQSK